MKIVSLLTLISALFFNIESAFARQYTQCYYMNENQVTEFYSVINLPSLEEGTLFLTLGTETDTHSLYKIKPSTTVDDQYYIFDTTDSTYPISVLFPKSAYNKASDNLDVILKEGSIDYSLKCFSRIYND